MAKKKTEEAVEPANEVVVEPLAVEELSVGEAVVTVEKTEILPEAVAPVEKKKVAVKARKRVRTTYVG